jgi:hypothetical protein
MLSQPLSRYLLVHSGDPTQVIPLVLYSFFFHKFGRQLHSASWSLFHPRFVYFANLQCTLQLLQHIFFSKFFHIGLLQNLQQKILLDTHMVRAALHFLFVLFS